MRGVFFVKVRERARGVFGSMIKIKYDDYGGDCRRMRVLEGRSHVRVLVDTSRARRAPEKPVVHWPRRGNPALATPPLKKGWQRCDNTRTR